MQKVWELFPRLTDAVKTSHEEYGMQGTGHNFDHTLQVGQVGTLIAETEDTARLAGAAGLCHNADRLLQKKLEVGKKDMPDPLVARLIITWITASGELSGADTKVVVDAVLCHSEKNRDDDGPVLIALKDADRIVCSGADTIMTAAAFWRELPALDPRWLTGDPSAHSYRNPGSVLKNLECRYDWVDPDSGVCVRLPKAAEMMGARVAFIEDYIRRIEDERREMGLWPNYPFEF